MIFGDPPVYDMSPGNGLTGRRLASGELARLGRRRARLSGLRDSSSACSSSPERPPCARRPLSGACADARSFGSRHGSGLTRQVVKTRSPRGPRGRLAGDERRHLVITGHRGTVGIAGTERRHVDLDDRSGQCEHRSRRVERRKSRQSERRGSAP